MSSPFGDLLREWRGKRRISQLDLALSAGTTPRYVSFLETGRSRPGEDVVLRLAEALDVPLRDRNALLRAAGLPPAYTEHALEDEALAGVRGVVLQVLRNHLPYPGLALGPGLRILELNATAEVLFEGIRTMPTEEIVARWFSEAGLEDASMDRPVVTATVRFGDRRIRCITTAMRFDKARDVTASELVVELMFPADDEAEEFFRDVGCGAVGG